MSLEYVLSRRLFPLTLLVVSNLLLAKLSQLQQHITPDARILSNLLLRGCDFPTLGSLEPGAPCAWDALDHLEKQVQQCGLVIVVANLPVE